MNSVQFGICLFLAALCFSAVRFGIFSDEIIEELRRDARESRGRKE